MHNFTLKPQKFRPPVERKAERDCVVDLQPAPRAAVGAISRFRLIDWAAFYGVRGL
jgi:hypothetical protein